MQKGVDWKFTTGYSDLVQFDDGEIYRELPGGRYSKAWIRGYSLIENDFLVSAGKSAEESA